MKAVYKDATDDRGKKGYWKGFWNNADRPTMRYDILGVLPVEGQWKWRKEIAEEAVKNYQEYEKYANKITLVNCKLNLNNYNQETHSIA